MPHDLASRPVSVLIAMLFVVMAGAVAASEPTQEPGRLLEEVDQLRLQERYAAMESLATVVRGRLEREARPDTALLAEAWHAVCESRNLRKLLSDSVGIQAGLRTIELLGAYPAGPDTLRYAAHRSVGWIHSSTGRSPQGLPHYRSALALARRHPEWGPAPISQVLYNMGIALLNVGEADSALVALEEARVHRERLDRPRDGLVGEIHAGIATVHLRQERLDRAEAAFETALRAHEKRLGPDDPGMVHALSRAAAFEFVRGNYARSIDHNQRALRILLGSNPPDKRLNLLTVRVALAQGLEQVGDVPRARATYEQAVPGLEAWLGRSHPVVLASWLSLGESASKMGDTGRALEVYEHIRQAYAADSSLTERTVLASATVNLARLRSDRTPDDSTLALAIEAERISRGLTGLDPTFTVLALCTQLRIHAHRNEWEDFDRVDAELGEELDRFAVPENNQSDEVWMVRSEAAEQRGRPLVAVEAAAEGARAARERLAWNARSLSDRQALLLAGTVSGPLDQLLRLAAGLDSATWRKAWDELARTRGIVIAEVSRRRMPPQLAADGALLEAHAAWVRAQQRLAREEVRLASSPRSAAAESTRAALRAEVDERERWLVRNAAPPPADAGRTGLDDVLSRLSADQALVAFAAVPGPRQSRRLIVFLARGASPAVRCLDLGPADRLKARVEQWRAELAAPASRRSEEACRRSGLLVREAIWDPIAKVTAGAKDLFLVPEAPVAGLPWGALPVGRSSYLVESGPVIHVLAAERELLRVPERPLRGGLLLVGGVDYDRVAPVSASTSGIVATTRSPQSACDSLALSRLDPLPGTAAEIDDVAKAWAHGPHAGEPVSRLEGAKAAEADFKQLASGRRSIHIATHGLLLRTDCAEDYDGTRGVGGVGPIPARRPTSDPAGRTGSAPGPPSGRPEFASPWIGRQVLLAFAGAARANQGAADENDGLLTAEEVATLDLRGVDWVVLSACQSASGETWIRQGVLGMERAFRLAGARTVIASQWSVDDESTRELMAALYEARAAGDGHSGDALKAATRRILAARRTSGRSTHPFYWAAFTANGE